MTTTIYQVALKWPAMRNLDHINSTNHRTSIIYRQRVNLMRVQVHRETHGISRVIKPPSPPLLSHQPPSPIIPRSGIVRPDGTLNAYRLPSEFPNCEGSNARERALSRAAHHLRPREPQPAVMPICGEDDGKCCYTRG